MASIPPNFYFYYLFLLMLTSQVQSRLLLTSLPHPKGGYIKTLGSLGMICQCCHNNANNGGDACTSKYDSSCLNLKCHPWKFF